MTSNEQSAGVSRRTVTKAMAWAVPAIAVAVPVAAHAASVCSPSTNFQGLQVGSRPSEVLFYDVNGDLTGVKASLGFSSTPGNTGKVAQTTGSGAWKYIELQITNVRNGQYIDFTLTFNQPVTGLSFMVHDIDRVQNQWVDQVEILTSGYTYVPGSHITGNGSSASPFTSDVWGDLPIESGQGSVRITYPGEVQTVEL
ncbi:MAG: hypothetical protein WA971_07905, partial [Microbacterium sp.]